MNEWKVPNGIPYAPPVTKIRHVLYALRGSGYPTYAVRNRVVVDKAHGTLWRCNEVYGLRVARIIQYVMFSATRGDAIRYTGCIVHESLSRARFSDFLTYGRVPTTVKMGNWNA